MLFYKTFPGIELGPFHLNFYGLFFVIGILAATWLAVRLGRKKNIPPDTISELVLYLLIGIILGARLFYLLFYWPAELPLTFLEAVALWKGGLAFFGGFLGALIAGLIYVRKHRFPFWEYADLFALPIVIGHIFGRIGDYLTGGHPGKVTALPWGIYLDGAFRHPVVLYEIIGLISIAFILFYLSKLQNSKHLFTGFLFASYAGLYSTQRLFLDFFRLESTDPRLFYLTPTQILSILLIIGVFGLFGYKMIKFLKSSKEER